MMEESMKLSNELLILSRKAPAATTQWKIWHRRCAIRVFWN